MKKLKLLILLFVLSVNLNSTELKGFFTLGSMGWNNLESGLDNNNVFISLPAFYLKDLDSKLGVSIESVRFNNVFSSSDGNTTFLKSTLFWSPININDHSVIGPFINAGLNFEESIPVTSEVGVIISLLYSVDSVFPEFNAPKSLALNGLNLEAGYSITNKDFYLSLSTDLSFIGLVFVQGEKDKMEKEYNIE